MVTLTLCMYDLKNDSFTTHLCRLEHNECQTEKCTIPCHTDIPHMI